MRIPEISRCAFGICAASALLSGCGGSQAQVGAPATIQQSAATEGRTARGDSRQGPGATTTAFTVSGRTILLDGKPFFIKGVDYGLTQIDDYPDPNYLDNANSQIWTPDLAAMRAAGVNALKVYNVNLTDFKKYIPPLSNDNKLKPGETGKIDQFLKAAWHGGDRPIFVVLCIFFGGHDVFDAGKLNALKAEYLEMSQEYAAYPAFMGISLGAEINSLDFVRNPKWWAALNEISDSITTGYQASSSQKIITTTMVDFVSNDGKTMPTVVEGTKNGFKIDAWGLDAYRGHTFTNIWQQLKDETTKPAIMAEYGAPASYYPASTARYENFSCTGYTKQQLSVDSTKELPGSGNPRMDFLVTYVTDNATELFANWANTGGVGSGGFYFEWNDEWWKSGWPKSHIGGTPGNVIVENGNYPGCYNDEAWFGLNSNERGFPNPRKPRPTLNAIKAVWAKKQ
jgi:hypothetical protein